jgi:hypothetical protein
MGLRMLEYAIAIFRRFRKWPEQVVLYVGLEPLRMAESFQGFKWRTVDVRDLDGEPLLESERLEDNVIAILLRQKDERKALWRILERCRDAEPEARAEALTALAVLVRLRNLGPMLKEEKAKMPIVIDWVNDEEVGPIIEEARQSGERQGESRMLVRQIEKRFGPLPQSAVERLAPIY